MKNVLVANFLEKSRYTLEPLKQLVNLQIENSIDVGWEIEDILLVTNFNHEFMGVKAINTELNKICITGSKMFGVQFLYKNNITKDSIWAHDLDAFQNVLFEEPEFKDVGITTYSRPNFNGGSVFWKYSALDIINKIVETINEKKSVKEEPILDIVLKDDLYKDRVSVLNNTYNVGCSAFVKRYDVSEKPIKVAHLHPGNRLAWETHVLDRNGIYQTSVCPRLEGLIRQYYPDLARNLLIDGLSKQQRIKDSRKNDNIISEIEKEYNYEISNNNCIFIMCKKEEDNMGCGCANKNNNKLSQYSGFIKNTDLVDFFKTLKDVEISNEEFLTKMVQRNIGIKLNTKTLSIPIDVQKYFGGLQSKQYPSELGQYLKFIYDKRSEINSYLEIGVERGGTFFTVDSFLRTVNPNFTGSLAIDKSEQILRNGYKEYKDKYKTVDFIYKDSKDVSLEQNYDLILIDGDHSYHGIKSDFEKVKDKAKYIVFHDIKCLIPGIDVKKFWEEIKTQYESYELINKDTRLTSGLGIGIIKVK